MSTAMRDLFAIKSSSDAGVGGGGASFCEAGEVAKPPRSRMSDKYFSVDEGRDLFSGSLKNGWFGPAL
jgi:hypothetical protein